MTPRALLTTIGATALAFAIAIGIAADSTFGTPTGATPSAVFAVESGSGARFMTTGAAGPRLAAWNGNDPCVIAL